MSIRQRLSRVEEDFLTAIADGSIDSFYDERWAPLTEEIESAIQSYSLDEETISLAYATSSRVAILADIFQDLYAAHKTLTSHLVDEVDTILSQLLIEDPPSRSYSPQMSPKYNVLPSADKESSVVSRRRITDAYHISFDSHGSPTPSLVSLSTADDSDEDTPAPIIGRKRNANSLDDFEGSGGAHSNRIIKRFRSSRSPSCEAKPFENQSVIRSFDSSPPSVVVANSTANNDQNGSLERQGGALCLEPPSRKRRLSDADAHAMPKRPRGFAAGPRLHAVSDPLPIGSEPAMQNLEDWFTFNLEIPDVPLLSWGEDENAAPFQIDFFDGWASLSVAPVDNISQTTKSSDIKQLLDVKGALEPIESPFLDILGISPSANDCGLPHKTVAENTSNDSMAIPSLTSDSSKLSDSLSGGSNSIQCLFPPSSAIDIAPSSMTFEVSSPSYKPETPSIAAAEPTELDVISLYTTLCDADHTRAPLICSDVPQPVVDSSLAPLLPLSEGVADEDWARFLTTLDQPPEVVLPSPPPPYHLSTDIAHLLESLLQPEEVSSTSTSNPTRPLPEKQRKLKELEAAKEAVRRLEAEVGITV